MLWPDTCKMWRSLRVSYENLFWISPLHPLKAETVLIQPLGKLEWVASEKEKKKRVDEQCMKKRI
jgi:hypothetical protein